MSGAPSALRGIHRQGVRDRNDILLLSVVYSLSYEDRVVGDGVKVSMQGPREPCSMSARVAG
jgi:hypothetical protein